MKKSRLNSSSSIGNNKKKGRLSYLRLYFARHDNRFIFGNWTLFFHDAFRDFPILVKILLNLSS